MPPNLSHAREIPTGRTVDSRRHGGHPMVGVKLYVAGSGDAKPLKTACRKGFSEFLKKVGLTGRMPRIVACGSRENA